MIATANDLRLKFQVMGSEERDSLVSIYSKMVDLREQRQELRDDFDDDAGGMSDSDYRLDQQLTKEIVLLKPSFRGWGFLELYNGGVKPSDIPDFQKMLDESPWGKERKDNAWVEAQRG